MNARLPEDWVSAYHDGELSPSERNEAERLLQESPTARAELEGFRELSRLLNALPVDKAPSELRHAVMQEAERSLLIPEVDTVPPAALPRLARPLNSFAYLWPSTNVLFAASILVATTLVLWNNGPRPVTDQPELVTQRDLAPSASALTLQDQLHANADVADEHDTGLYMGIVSNSVPFPADDSANGISNEQGNLFSEANMAAEMVRGQSLSQTVKREMLQNPQFLGQIFYYFPSDDDQVAVVEMTVVDVRKSAGQLQVLLSQNAVLPESSTAINPATVVEENQTSEPDDDLAASVADEESDPSEELVVVFVQATPEQLAATVRDLGLNNDVVDFSLHPPLQGNVDQLASGDTQVWSQLDDSLSRQSAAETERMAAGSEATGKFDAEARMDKSEVADNQAADFDKFGSRDEKSPATRRQSKKQMSPARTPVANKSKDRSKNATVPPIAALRFPNRARSNAEPDVAIALKPGQTRESLSVEADGVMVPRERARFSYQRVLPVPEDRKQSLGGQQFDSSRIMAQNSISANENRVSGQRLKKSLDDGVEAMKPHSHFKNAELAETQRPVSPEAIEEGESVAPSELSEVKVLFVFTRPRTLVAPASEAEAKQRND